MHVINVRENRPAELIAKFVDARLRSGGEALTEDELETLLSKVSLQIRDSVESEGFVPMIR